MHFNAFFTVIAASAQRSFYANEFNVKKQTVQLC